MITVVLADSLKLLQLEGWIQQEEGEQQQHHHHHQQQQHAKYKQASYTYCIVS